jgi:protein gp37
LLATPAAVRFLSAEPLLEPIDLDATTPQWIRDASTDETRDLIDWVIVGGESGHGARPMHPDWARSIRDQCQAADVAFFMKQMSGVTKASMPPIPDDLMIRQFPDTHTYGGHDG